MADIKKRLLDGGTGLWPGSSIPDLREILTGAVDDLAEIRTVLNKVRTDHADHRTAALAVRTLLNEAKADYAVASADVTDLRARALQIRTLMNEAKADFNATLLKLDADVLVAAVDYAALRTVAAADVAVVAALTHTAIAAADVSALGAATATADAAALTTTVES